MGTIQERSLLQRILGISATKTVAQGSWSPDGKNIRIDLGRIPEVSMPGTGVRIEGKDLPDRFLLIHGTDGEFHVFSNRCRHGGRRLDPHGDGLRCCSVGKATYDLGGTILSGPAKKNLKKYSIRKEKNIIIIEV